MDGLSACRDSKHEFNLKKCMRLVDKESEGILYEIEIKEFTFLTGYGFIVEHFPNFRIPFIIAIRNQSRSSNIL